MTKSVIDYVWIDINATLIINNFTVEIEILLSGHMMCKVSLTNLCNKEKETIYTNEHYWNDKILKYRNKLDNICTQRDEKISCATERYMILTSAIKTTSKNIGISK